MNILMIHPHDIYHDLEPWTVRITYLAKELVRAGHKVKLVYHLLDPDSLEASSNRQDFPFETIPLTRDDPRLGRRCREMASIACWADVVHFQKCHPYVSIPAVYSAFWHRRPVHYDWDDWEEMIYRQQANGGLVAWAYFNQMERFLPKLADTISVASQALESLAIKRRFPAERIFYVPVGADIDKFSPGVDGSEIRSRHSIGGKLVLYHGQISGANYVHLFLRTAALVLARRRDVTFAVVGGGDRLHLAKELTRELGVGDKILFTGEAPHDEIPRFIAAADVAVACFEDNEQARCKSPLKVVEYLASGKAIVASRMGEVTHMLDGCALLTEPESPEALAEGVERLLESPDLRRELGRQARLRAEERYSWRRGAERLIEAYQKAVRFHYGLG